jgi:hypothetical protein
VSSSPYRHRARPPSCLCPPYPAASRREPSCSGRTDSRSEISRRSRHQAKASHRRRAITSLRCHLQRRLTHPTTIGTRAGLPPLAEGDREPPTTTMTFAFRRRTHRPSKTRDDGRPRTAPVMAAQPRSITRRLREHQRTVPGLDRRARPRLPCQGALQRATVVITRGRPHPRRGTALARADRCHRAQ